MPMKDPMDEATVRAKVTQIVAEELAVPITPNVEMGVGKRSAALPNVTGSTLLGVAVMRIMDRVTHELHISFSGDLDPSKTVDDLVNDIMPCQ